MNPVTLITGRYGKVSCQITKIDEYRYRFEADGCYRFGGFAATETDRNGFSFVDPAGGPFIAVDDFLSDFHKDLPERKIIEIASTDEGIVFTLE